MPTAPVDAEPTADHDGDESSAAIAGEADADPPSPGRCVRRGTLAAALVLGGALLLGLSASPAGAQEGGGDGGGDSGGMGSSFGGSSYGGDSGGMSSGFGGDSGSGVGTDSGGFSSADSSGFSGADSSGFSSDSSGFGSTDSGYCADTTTSYGGESDTSTYGGETTGYAGSDTGTTGFEGSPETGPAHAEAVNTNSPTWSAPTTTSEVSTYSGETTGFESSPETGPAHAEAVNTNSPTWSAPTTSEVSTYSGETTGFESSPETGPTHAEAVNTNSPTWSAPTEPTTTGFEASPELGPVLAQAMLDGENLARLDAAIVQQSLAALGIDPATFHPDQMRTVDPASPAYAGLFDAIRTLGDEMTNPPRGDDRISSPYAARAYETLDVAGTRAMLGAINNFAVDQAWQSGPPLGDVRTTLLSPVVDGFALATLSPIAPTDVFDGLRNLEARWQQHQLGELMSGGFAYDPATGLSVRVPSVSYDPSQLAQFADAVIGFGRIPPGGIVADNLAYDPQAADPYARAIMPTGPLMWNGDAVMQVPEALALRALSVNPEASWQFTEMRPENLATVVRPTEGFQTIFSRQIGDLMNQYGADTIRGALIDAVAADLSRFPGAVDRYADMTRLMGQDLTSDPMRQAYVDVLSRYFTTPDGRFVGSYIDEIGNAALDQRATVFGDDDARRMAQDFNRVDLVNAWSEVGRSEAAARALGAVMAGWTALRTAGFLDDGDLQRGEVEAAVLPNALVLDTIRQGFEAIGVPTASRQAWADTVRNAGSIYAAFAGPVANFLGGRGLALPATLAGASGSLAWAGSTIASNVMTSTDPPPVRGDDFSRALAETLRADMAATLAARRGESPPTGRDLATALSTAFPAAGDPFTTLMTLSAIEGYTNQHPGTHWSTH